MPPGANSASIAAAALSAVPAVAAFAAARTNASTCMSGSGAVLGARSDELEVPAFVGALAEVALARPTSRGAFVPFVANTWSPRSNRASGVEPGNPIPFRAAVSHASRPMFSTTDRGVAAAAFRLRNQVSRSSPRGSRAEWLSGTVDSMTWEGSGRHVPALPMVAEFHIESRTKEEHKA
jgi:hypothetical protein